MRANLLVASLVTGLLVISVLAPGVALADDATLGARGSGVVPLENDAIEMESERVDVWLYPSWAFVEAQFTLHNTGPAVDLLVGFPQEKKSAEESIGRDVSDLELKNFTAEVDGQSVATAFKVDVSSPELPGLNVAGWQTFEVPLASGQTRHLKNTYLVRLVRISNGDALFSYILRTGALWKGSIRVADIIVHPSGGLKVENLRISRGTDSALSQVTPSTDHRIENGAVAWTLGDIEPSPQDDITILVSPHQPAGNAVTSLDVPEAGAGETVAVSVGSRGGVGPWPAGSRWIVYAGEPRVKLGEIIMSSQDVQVFGSFTIPNALSSYSGRAVEVWAERQPSGARALSTLLLIKGAPQSLPPSGKPVNWVGLSVASIPFVGVGIGLRSFARLLASRSRRYP